VYFVGETQNVTIEFNLKTNRYYKSNSYLKLYGDEEGPSSLGAKVLVYIEYCIAGRISTRFRCLQ